MFLEKPNEDQLKNIELDEFEIELMKLVKKHVQPERSKREDSKEMRCSELY